MKTTQAQNQEQLQGWNIKKWLKNIITLGVKVPLWGIQYLGCFIPIKKNRILIYSLKQNGFSGNLKYLYQELQKNYTEFFEILWIVKNSDVCKHFEKSGIPVTNVHSWKHFLYRHRAGIVITDDEFYAPCINRKKQLLINVWHGGINYKKIGFSGIRFANQLQKYIYHLSNPQPDIFISGSQSFLETSAKAFDFDKKIFFECGLPRNVVFFKDYSHLYKKVRTTLNLPETSKLVLYAPTFRKGLEAPATQFNWAAITNTLKERFGGDWIILIRQHYFVKGKTAESENIIDVSEYEDMQELLCACDCLVSDYSSCMWDYSFTGRPCFVLGEDLDEYYEHDRSFSIPLEKWPYSICRNEQELCDRISTFDSDAYIEKVKCHHLEMGSYENENASQLLIKKMIEKLEEI